MTPLEPVTPHDLDAERSVLGAILLDNATLDAAATVWSCRQWSKIRLCAARRNRPPRCYGT